MQLFVPRQRASGLEKAPAAAGRACCAQPLPRSPRASALPGLYTHNAAHKGENSPFSSKPLLSEGRALGKPRANQATAARSPPASKPPTPSSLGRCHSLCRPPAPLPPAPRLPARAQSPSLQDAEMEKDQIRPSPEHPPAAGPARGPAPGSLLRGSSRDEEALPAVLGLGRSTQASSLLRDHPATNNPRLWRWVGGSRPARTRAQHLRAVPRSAGPGASGTGTPGSAPSAVQGGFVRASGGRPAHP